MSIFETANESRRSSSDSFVSLASSGEAPLKVAPTVVTEQSTETNFSLTEISSILPTVNFFVETTSTFDLSITPTHSRLSLSPGKPCGASEGTNNPEADIESPALVDDEEPPTVEQTVSQTSAVATEPALESRKTEDPHEPLSPPEFPLTETPPRSPTVALPTEPVELSDSGTDDEQQLDQIRMDRRTQADPDRRLTSVLVDDMDSDSDNRPMEEEELSREKPDQENTPQTSNKERELPPYMTLTPAHYRHGNNKKDDDSDDDALLTPMRSTRRRRPQSRKKTPQSLRTPVGDADDSDELPEGDFGLLRKALVSEWYPRMNEQVFDNRLPLDMEITWNNRMLTTAGVTVFKKGVCRIELSTKVLDRPLRVCKTLLHEMCHAAQFILSGELRPPHGPAFKKWARIASAVFPQYTVTISHSYEVRAKYSFLCTDCGHKLSRHTKSVNVYTQRCKRCGGQLIQDKTSQL